MPVGMELDGEHNQVVPVASPPRSWADVVSVQPFTLDAETSLSTHAHPPSLLAVKTRAMREGFMSLVVCSQTIFLSADLGGDELNKLFEPKLA